jgi:ubiquinone/menaquinone biosynthesis C-methylase UbiE
MKIMCSLLKLSIMDKHYQYEGNELELFREAVNWKQYFARKIKPYIGSTVLEVGAGIGATTSILNDGTATSWTMLEPDERMFHQLQSKSHHLPKNVILNHGTITDASQQYDTILYIDVLEHIKNDRQELEAAAASLNPGGFLVVLSPAFNFLYSEFDKAIGHHRRYTKRELVKLRPSNTALVYSKYLDTAGFLASAMNKIILHQAYPTKKQVKFWDKMLIPLSRITDPLFLYSFGKTILVAWQKAANSNDQGIQTG